MNKYLEMKERHQEEINKFPIFWAFTEQRYEEIKKEINAKDEDLISINGGGFLRKTDANNFIELIKRQAKEKSENLKNEDFAFEAFMYEAANHEFGYTWEPEETFESLGLTIEEVENNPLLSKAWEKAKQTFIEKEEEE